MPGNEIQPVAMTSSPTEILFCAYYFPPVGGSGVQRASKFVKYLPDAGILPLVVAGPAEGAGRWEPTDTSLAEELGEGISVHRPPPPPGGRRSGGRAARLLGRPEPAFAWWRDSLVAAGLEAASGRDPKLVFVTMSPFESLVPALELGRRLSVPVIADLRDPWALDEVKVYPTRWHRAAAKRAMGRQLALADRVLMNTPGSLDALREAFPRLDPERLHCLTNGYDAEDFEPLAPREPDGRFRIVHSGYLHSELAKRHAERPAWINVLGGELARVDFYGRSHRYLLEALERIQREEPSRFERIEVELLGVLSEGDRALVAASSAAEHVKLRGYTSHDQTVAAQVAADLLFLPMYGLPPGRRARIVPAKTYEYLASGRPILAAVPEGDVRDFVLAAGAGRVTRPEDVSGIASAIAAFQDEAPAPSRPPTEPVLRFERRRLSAELAEHVRDLVGSRA